MFSVMKKKLIRYILIAIAIGVGIILMNTQKKQRPIYHPRDYTEIVQSGLLRVVTEYNSISYHASQDTIQGFDYELLNTFANAHGLQLEITPDMSFEKRLNGVCTGQYDLLGTGTVVTSQSKDSLLFTRTIWLSKQVLVQRKLQEGMDSLYIKNQLDLAGKHLYVTKGSPALLRIHNLISEIADTIYVEEVDLYGPEQLMAMVAEGDINYAVCDESIAQSIINEFPNLDIDTDISFTQFYAWGVSKHSPVLLDSLNAWLNTYMETKEFQRLIKKYFNRVP